VEKEGRIERAIRLLREKNIELDIDGCGCCGSPGYVWLSTGKH
jgi:hypothetical protein